MADDPQTRDLSEGSEFIGTEAGAFGLFKCSVRVTTKLHFDSPGLTWEALCARGQGDQRPREEDARVHVKADARATAARMVAKE